MHIPSFLAERLADLVGEGQAANQLRQWSEKQARRAEIRQICDQAMQRAGYAPGDGLAIRDIGVLVYHSPEKPRIVRGGNVKIDARWVRPFLELKAPRNSKFQVDVEILDGRGQRRFFERVAETRGNSRRIVTRNWLPLVGLALDARFWHIAFSIGGTRIAIYRLHWQRLGGDQILRDMREDGEINGELQVALKEGRFRRMSLDELLADQED